MSIDSRNFFKENNHFFEIGGGVRLLSANEKYSTNDFRLCDIISILLIVFENERGRGGTVDCHK